MFVLAKRIEVGDRRGRLVYFPHSGSAHLGPVVMHDWQRRGSERRGFALRLCDGLAP